jgi:SNF2 family DNA or RNA helicase
LASAAYWPTKCKLAGRDNFYITVFAQCARAFTAATRSLLLLLPVFHRGLGKSLQALTALAVLRIEKNMNTAPFLVVCPASVVLHWYDETKRFFPTSLLCPLRFSELSTSPGKDLQPASVVVVSYEMLRRDISLGPQRSVLISRLWEAVVLDEAHLIKNPAAGTSKAVCALKSLHRIALSGTPVQNQVGMRRI